MSEDSATMPAAVLLAVGKLALEERLVPALWRPGDVLRPIPIPRAGRGPAVKFEVEF